MSIYHKLFKAYDVRGTLPNIDEKVYYWTAKGLVETILKPQNLPLLVNLLRDCRYSSPEFYKAFYNGLLDAGAKPQAMGLGSTDFMYAACQLFQNPGVMITASHNPKDDNGIKIVKQAPQMLGLETGLDKVRDYVLANIDTSVVDKSNWIEPSQEDEVKEQVWEFYQKIISKIGKIDTVNDILKKSGRRLKIVADAANGMGGFLMEKVKALYPYIDFIPLYWEMDGNYPNHPADPSKVANMQDCITAIQNNKADFGVCFDGDADRGYIIDETGTPTRDNFLVATIAKTVLKEYFAEPNLNFNPAIVYSQPQSRCVPFAVLESGGVPVPSKQGHTYIKADMKRYKAIYGGEGTGHHYFGEFGYMDSGILVLAKVISLLVEGNIPASDLVKPYDKIYHLSGELNFKLENGLDYQTAKEKLLARYTDGVVSMLDGLSIFYHDWKLSTRASNTEPVLRLNIESIGENKLSKLISDVKETLGLA